MLSVRGIFKRVDFLMKLLNMLDGLRFEDELLEQPVKIFNRPISIGLSRRDEQTLDSQGEAESRQQSC